MGEMGRYHAMFLELYDSVSAVLEFQIYGVSLCCHMFWNITNFVHNNLYVSSMTLTNCLYPFLNLNGEIVSAYMCIHKWSVTVTICSPLVSLELITLLPLPGTFQQISFSEA